MTAAIIIGTLCIGSFVALWRMDRREEALADAMMRAHGDWPATSQMNVTEHDIGPTR